MQDVLQTTTAQVVIVTVVLAILVLVGCYVVGRFRGSHDEGVLGPNDLLTNFRELHHKGEINELEFRTIKTALQERLQEELNNKDDED